MRPAIEVYTWDDLARQRSATVTSSASWPPRPTDSFTAAKAASFAPDDWRRMSPQYQSPNLERNLALRDALRPIAAKHGVTVASVAVAWTIAWPGVTSAIVGARSPEQVDGWLPAATLRLDSDDLAAIAAAIERSGAGSGPARPA